MITELKKIENASINLSYENNLDFLNYQKKIKSFCWNRIELSNILG